MTEPKLNQETADAILDGRKTAHLRIWASLFYKEFDYQESNVSSFLNNLADILDNSLVVENETDIQISYRVWERYKKEVERLPVFNSAKEVIKYQRPVSWNDWLEQQPECWPQALVVGDELEWSQNIKEAQARKERVILCCFRCGNTQPFCDCKTDEEISLRKWEEYKQKVEYVTNWIEYKVIASGEKPAQSFPDWLKERK